MALFSYQSIKDSKGRLCTKFVEQIVQCFDLENFIETGTHYGDTIDVLAPLFKNIFSIELGKELYEKAVKRFEKRDNIHLINAPSPQGLAQIFSEDTLPALIWLDAHYSGGDTVNNGMNCPATEEISTILSFNRPHDILLLDDIRYFIKPVQGFLQHEAITGYPELEAIITTLQNSRQKYICYVFCDALLAVPAAIQKYFEATPVLQACTQSRNYTNGQDLSEIEFLISSAYGTERDALLDIPKYMKFQSEYGLGGHYFYWRALVEHPPRISDISFATKAGVIPASSRLLSRSNDLLPSAGMRS